MDLCRTNAIVSIGLVLGACASLVCAGCVDSRTGATMTMTGGDGGLPPGNPADCMEPASQGVSQPCCLPLGVDACGAGLFCAALDGRTVPSCYANGSRMDGESCTADVQCSSGSCNTDQQTCRTALGACDPSVGCAPSVTTGGEQVCALSSDGSYTCDDAPSGNLGSPCTQNSDCSPPRPGGTVQCTSGFCTVLCSSDYECGPGNACETTYRLCTKLCSSAQDCPVPLGCVDDDGNPSTPGLCGPCISDTDCRPGLTCNANGQQLCS